MTLHARDIMNTKVITVPTTMDLRDLSKLLLAQAITGAPVVDSEGRLAGVISQTDLVYYNLARGDSLTFDSNFYHAARVEGQHVPGGFQFEDFNTGCVADAMTPVVHTVSERATVESVARIMTRKHIHRVIVTRGRRVAGIISALDVLRVHGRRTKTASKATPAKATKGAKKKATKSARATTSARRSVRSAR